MNKVHTTNYYNTFIEIAKDCLLQAAEIPPMKGDEKTAARIQYEMMAEHPYTYTSDEILFAVFIYKNKLTDLAVDELAAERLRFFSKGQACFRSSSLGKRYGWGVHANSEGKVAIYEMESEMYTKFANNPDLEHTRAMQSKKV